MTTTRDKVLAAIREVRPDAPAGLAEMSGSANLMEAGLLDSLTLLQLLAEIERLRGRELDLGNTDVGSLACIDGLVALLETP